MVLFLNTSGTLGMIIATGTSTLTGNILATLLLIYMVLIAICIFLNIPIEFMLVIMLPLTLVCMAYTNFLIPATLLLIFIAILITRNFIGK